MIVGKNVFSLFFYCLLWQLRSLLQGKQGEPKEGATGNVLSCLGVIKLFVDSMIHYCQNKPLQHDKKIASLHGRQENISYSIDSMSQKGYLFWEITNISSSDRPNNCFGTLYLIPESKKLQG